MLFFRSEEHVERWCGQWGQRRGAILDLPVAWSLAQAWYGAPRNTPGWRRFTAEEAEQVFSRLGLQGGFWSLRA